MSSVDGMTVLLLYNLDLLKLLSAKLAGPETTYMFSVFTLDPSAPRRA
jgi:hypothetical protein